LFLVLSINFTYSQVPNWTWAKKAGAAKGERANAVATDNSGNVFVCGDFQSHSVHGHFDLFNSGYGSDIFIAKFDNGSNPIWERSYGGIDHDVPLDICIDAFGNIYLAGYFLSPQAKFDNDTFINSSVGKSDFFLIKLDIYANILWGFSGGGNGNDQIRSISVDGSGNLYMCGIFESDSIILGSDTLINSSQGTSDFFISKLDPSGNFVWNLSAGGNGDDEATSISTIATGETYISGDYGSDTLTLGTSNLINAGNSDLFLAKLNPNGTFLWSLSAGGFEYDSAHAVTADGQGNVYLAGGFSSDSIGFGGSILYNTGAVTSDAFISSFDPNGSLIWNKSIGGINSEKACGVYSDFAGNICLAGLFMSPSITVDSITFTNTSASNDIFLIQYNSTGNLIWATKLSGSLEDISTDVTIGPGGTIYSIGYFLSPELNLGSGSLTNFGKSMTFITRYANNGTLIWADPIVYPYNNDNSWDIATDSNRNSFVTGWFRSSSLHFDTFEVKNTNTVYDLFIVKYDSMGSVKWANGAVGKGVDYGTSLCIDPFDNLYVTGYFADTITFGSVTLPGPGNIFITKIDNNGNILWAKEYGDGSITYDICTDLDGNIYVAGWFSTSTSMFGSFTLTNSAPNYSEIFIMKLDSSGNVLWAQSAQGNYHEMTSGIAVDQEKNVFVTGYYASDSIQFGSTTIHNNGYHDIFITKLDSNGTFLWTSGVGDHYNDWPNAICTDPSGNAYITGYFSSASITFGMATLINPSVSKKETFIARYNSDGSVGWAKSAGGIESDEATDIASAAGNIYQTGKFNSPTITFGSYVLSAQGSFITRYDTTGNILYAFDIGESSTNAISTNENGSLNVTGHFSSDELHFGADTLSCLGGYNIFVARMDSMLYTAASEVSRIDKINIYPNPFTSEITFFSSTPLKDATIILFNVLGESISEIKKINGHSSTITLDKLQRGIYFLRITQGDKIISTKKIIKVD